MFPGSTESGCAMLLYSDDSTIQNRLATVTQQQNGMRPTVHPTQMIQDAEYHIQTRCPSVETVNTGTKSHKTLYAICFVIQPTIEISNFSIGNITLSVMWPPSPPPT